MTSDPPESGAARPPSGPRDPGDAWVVAPSGDRYWGRFGASGLLAIDPDRGVLLQHRVTWSHFGDTWALPGGARHEGESAVAGALRESAEEAGVPDGSVRPRLTSVLDLGIWSYATVVADVVEPFAPVISDPESHALAWVPVPQVTGLPLHPGFAASWPQLSSLLEIRPVIVVDAANVVGSVPDGWWRDRAGAAARLLSRLAARARRGVAADALELPADVWFPQWRVVLEGQARSAHDREAGIDVVRAPEAGDDTITAEAARAVSAGERVTVVTSDRGLAERAVAAGASVRSSGWLLDLLDADGPAV